MFTERVAHQTNCLYVLQTYVRTRENNGKKTGTYMYLFVSRMFSGAPNLCLTWLAGSHIVHPHLKNININLLLSEPGYPEQSFLSTAIFFLATRAFINTFWWLIHLQLVSVYDFMLLLVIII